MPGLDRKLMPVLVSRAQPWQSMYFQGVERKTLEVLSQGLGCSRTKEVHVACAIIVGVGNGRLVGVATTSRRPLWIRQPLYGKGYRAILTLRKVRIALRRGIWQASLLEMYDCCCEAGEAAPTPVQRATIQ